MFETELAHADRAGDEAGEPDASLADLHPADMPATDSTEESGEGDLVVDGVSKRFRSRRNEVHALDNIDLHVRPVSGRGWAEPKVFVVPAGLSK
jgi:hypothetical protein